MQPLDRILRSVLETAVAKARDIAEAAARAALEQLGVGDAKVPAYLSPEERELRVRLRVHGRQLGDMRDPSSGKQEIDRLVEEVAYEHWHRMLFARFLAENRLLMYPDPVAPVPVSLEECRELAPDEGARDGWELAARYATRMLPQIFRPTSPVFALTLPPEHEQALERLMEGLDPQVFTASDGLGWVYQFWQAKRKEEVNRSEVKIGARELPAVTQLFTEPYMVSFLLDNALGAWWVGKVSGLGVDGGNGPELRPGARRILETAQTEDELRAFFALPGVPLEYLRFVRDENESWRPAAGWFEGWPATLADLTMLDPCCGSGHFLVAVLIMLAPMRMELEGLAARDAVDAALSQNIHGLEIDRRCVEIAAFALALAAWAYPDAGGYRPLPELHLACSGLSISVSKREWLDLAQKAADRMVDEQARTLLPEASKESLWHTQLKAGMEALYDLFEDAPVLGSLINPNQIQGDMFRADYSQITDILQDILIDQGNAIEVIELGVVAHGLAEARKLLARHYTLVVTNVPYLARGKQSEELRDNCSISYSDAKNDLATVFLSRAIEYCASRGTVSIVVPQNWLFLSSYSQFRKRLLSNYTWNMVARLGEGGFDSPAAAGAFTALVILSRLNTRKDHAIVGYDVSEPRTSDGKQILLTNVDGTDVYQRQLLQVPDARVTFRTHVDLGSLAIHATSYLGLGTGDIDKYGRNFWELIVPKSGWSYLQSAPQNSSMYDGLEMIVMWNSHENRVDAMDDLHRARIHNQDQSGQQAWSKSGVSVALMRGLRSSIYCKSPYSKSMAVLVPTDDTTMLALWAYVSSDQFHASVREIDHNIIVANGTLVKVPFDLDHWTQVAAEQYPHGLPDPYSDDPTQWIFHGHPCGSVVWDKEAKWTAHGPLRTDDTVLQVAVARLLGYRWPAELDPEMELAVEQRAWVERCAALLPLADKDGIVCIPPVRGELGAADRLVNLLAAAYGNAHGATWSTATLDKLLAAVGWAGKSLESWLRDKFFAAHCKLFQHRPFIWHIWDGQRDGFSALVNYHKLDYKLLETLIYTYLGDWIKRQQQDIAQGIDGAQERKDAARALQKRLELILKGEAPYDIFVRWKPLEEQPIGWNPDLNDGVRLNIRPFMSVPDVGRKGAGVLRDKPNIKWTKDRGKDVATAPWFHLGPEYGGKEGDRINDHHLTLEEKVDASTRKISPQ